MSVPAAADPTKVPWRTGRQYGIHLYAETGQVPGEDDEAIGKMFSRELADAAVEAHNRALL